MAGILTSPLRLRWSAQRPGRVRTRLTAAGWGFVVLILCGFLLAVNYSNNLIFSMACMLVSMALVGWYQTRSNVQGLVLSDWRTEPVFAGQRAVYRLRLSSPQGSEHYGLLAVAPEAVAGAELQLPGGGEAEMRLERPALRRGILEPAPALLRSRFPLGIFEARLASKPLPECLVYPRPAGEQPLPQQAAGSQAHRTAEAGTYTDLRRYTPGDPLSRISWKAFARFDELYTKRFDGAQGQPALWLRWEDVRAADVEARLSQLCRWVLDAHQQGREYGLELPGQRIEPAGEAAQLERCLRALALQRTHVQSGGGR